MDIVTYESTANSDFEHMFDASDKDKEDPDDTRSLTGLEMVHILSARGEHLASFLELITQ